MDPSSAQEVSSQTLESMVVSAAAKASQQEKKPRPADEQSQKCPRCESTNTKFCYYNNYSLSQPRYFCKSCRRYWTKGGTLRNVPVGGGCRKNRRSSSSKSRSIITAQQDQSLTNFPYESSNLSLPFATQDVTCNSNNTLRDVLGSSYATHGFLDSLRGTGFLETPTNGLFHNNNSLYYGAMGEIENPYETHMNSGLCTAVKQEICNGGRDNEGGDNRALWGYSWQLGSEGNMVISDVDSSRQSCNLGFGSSWHGLVNSPLM